MTSQNPTTNDPKSVTNPASKGDKPTEIKRELTDEETAAVAGGQASAPPTKLGGGGIGTGTNG